MAEVLLDGSGDEEAGERRHGRARQEDGEEASGGVGHTRFDGRSAPRTVTAAELVTRRDDRHDGRIVLTSGASRYQR